MNGRPMRVLEGRVPASANTAAEAAFLGAVLLRAERPFTRTARDLVGLQDFTRERHRLIFQAILTADEMGDPSDLVTVRGLLADSGDLDEAGGACYLGRLVVETIDTGRKDYLAGLAERIKRKTRERRKAATLESARLAIERGQDDEAAVLLRSVSTPEPSEDEWLGVCSPEEIADPEAGVTNDHVEDLIPEASNLLAAAEKKTGKTITMYGGMLAAIGCQPVWGHFHPREGLRVLLAQFEMPAATSIQRLQKLATGLGIEHDELADWIRDGRLALLSQPDLDLCSPRDRLTFHRRVLDMGAHIVLVDSVGEAFLEMDPNDNGAVRRHLRPALNPLTREGVSTVLLHHRRKSQPGVEDDESNAMLGAQSFTAKASRIYSITRAQAESRPGEFAVRFKSCGSWTLIQEPEFHLQIMDTPDGKGTTVRHLGKDEAVAAGIEPAQHRHLRAIVEALNDTPGGITSTALQARMVEEHGMSKSQFTKALRLGRSLHALTPLGDRGTPIRAGRKALCDVL